MRTVDQLRRASISVQVNIAGGSNGLPRGISIASSPSPKAALLRFEPLDRGIRPRNSGPTTHEALKSKRCWPNASPT
jgi:hypothetical protein